MNYYDNSPYFIKYKNKCKAPQEDCLTWAAEHCTQLTSHDVEINTPMLILIRKESKEDRIERRYFAATPESFERLFMRTEDEDRHFDEIVIDGPVKLFVDLELHVNPETVAKYKCTSAEQLKQKCEESAAALIGYLVAYHAREHDVCVTPIINTSHKESKWSQHVTFDGSVWRNNQHCKHFILGLVVKQALRDPLLQDLVDKGIYERNHPMRTYRSTKNDEPSRSMLGPGENMRSPPDLERLRRSLITCIKIKVPQTELIEDTTAQHGNNDVGGGVLLPPPLQPPMAANSESDEIYLTTMFLRLHVTEPEVFGLKYISCPGYSTNRLLNTNLCANAIGTTRYLETFAATEENLDNAAKQQQSALDVAGIQQSAKETKTAQASTTARGLTQKLTDMLFDYFDPYKPQKLSVDAHSGMVIVSCKSKDCIVKGSPHKHNHVFILVNVQRKTWTLRCHDTKCQQLLETATIQWRVLPDVMSAECDVVIARWLKRMPKLRLMFTKNAQPAVNAVYAAIDPNAGGGVGKYTCLR